MLSPGRDPFDAKLPLEPDGDPQTGARADLRFFVGRGRGPARIYGSFKRHSRRSPLGRSTPLPTEFSTIRPRVR